MLDLGDVINGCGVYLHPHRWRSSLGETQEIRSTAGGRRWIEHDSDTRDAGGNLFKKLEPLSGRRWLKFVEPGDVATGFCYAVDKDGRVRHSYENVRIEAGHFLTC